MAFLGGVGWIKTGMLLGWDGINGLLLVLLPYLHVNCLDEIPNARRSGSPSFSTRLCLLCALHTLITASSIEDLETSLAGPRKWKDSSRFDVAADGLQIERERENHQHRFWKSHKSTANQTTP